MIARVWRGWTSVDDADAYASYVEQTGIKGYRAIPGNQGAWILGVAASSQGAARP
jgi:hypothetical protein